MLGKCLASCDENLLLLIWVGNLRDVATCLLIKALDTNCIFLHLFEITLEILIGVQLSFDNGILA